MDDAFEKSPLIISRIATPKMGINTIRNEKRAISSFLAPVNSPVAMVAPLREIPGITATACAMPMMNALPHVISEFPFFTKWANASRLAVMSSMLPTSRRFPVKNCSICSINNSPIKSTGTVDNRSLKMYCVDSFH
jgi:hypothetical protein